MSLFATSRRLERERRRKQLQTLTAWITLNPFSVSVACAESCSHL
jgi:hypothetical protein